MEKIYISGKITGIEAEAPALFSVAANQLKQQGYKVVNPMLLSHNHDKSWESYMKEDIKAMCDCDSIYMLKNWEHSKGALVELNLARVLGLKIIWQ